MWQQFVEEMQKKGVTASKVSQETGIAESLISKYKRGERSPGAKNLIRLAEYFGVTVDQLLR